MARKMTPAQIASLALINEGATEAEIVYRRAKPDSKLSAADCFRWTLLTKHDCMDGAIVRCHRTVKTDTPAGSQVQGFRIAADGTVSRFI